MGNPLDKKYHLELAAAFALGSLPELPHDQLVHAAEVAGLKMHRFKQTQVLPRVARAVGYLKSLNPTSLLDVGSGRGTSLVQILLDFPDLEITACDKDSEYAKNLKSLFRGLNTIREGEAYKAYQWKIDREYFLLGERWDGATALEVLEHLENPVNGIRNVMTVVKRFVVFSVPSEADSNPDHHTLFTARDLEGLFKSAGAKTVSIDRVPGHFVGLALK
jgi:2-polyprenyl-3-methyl-5-hydroxy-6-metoxy-1,4-benzoquinol methylase